MEEMSYTYSQRALPRSSLSVFSISLSPPLFPLALPPLERATVLTESSRLCSNFTLNDNSRSCAVTAERLRQGRAAWALRLGAASPSVSPSLFKTLRTAPQKYTTALGQAQRRAELPRRGQQRTSCPGPGARLLPLPAAEKCAGHASACSFGLILFRWGWEANERFKKFFFFF